MSSILLTFALGTQQCYVSNGAKFLTLLLEFLFGAVVYHWILSLLIIPHFHFYN